MNMFAPLKMSKTFSWLARYFIFWIFFFSKLRSHFWKQTNVTNIYFNHFNTSKYVSWVVLAVKFYTDGITSIKQHHSVTLDFDSIWGLACSAKKKHLKSLSVTTHLFFLSVIRTNYKEKTIYDNFKSTRR